MIITPEDFGAVGGGADDTIPMGQFFDAINGNIGILSGMYLITSEIAKSLSNCTIIGNGVGGLTGSFGYSLLRLLDVSKVSFVGVSFINNYNNSTDDLGLGVVYSYNNISNLSFKHCSFSCPTASTQGLAIYTRINATDNVHTINNLFIEDNFFVSIGRVGCIIMNRGVFVDQYEAAQHVRFNRNIGKDLGLTSSIGFLLTLDGFGSDFSCNENSLSNCLFLGLENTCWINGNFIGNKFSNFNSSRHWSPMSFSNSGWDGWLFGGGQPYMTGLTIDGNICVDPSNQRSNFIGVSNSEFRGNHFVTVGDYAFHERDSIRNNHWGDRYKSDFMYAAVIGESSTTTQYNTWKNCVVENLSCSTNSSTILFDGSLTKYNRFCGSILKGTGGSSYGQTNSASNNTIVVK